MVDETDGAWYQNSSLNSRSIVDKNSETDLGTTSEDIQNNSTKIRRFSEVIY